MLGSKIVLNNKEEEVNKILMKLKLREHDEGFNNPKLFIPSRHFFETKEDLEKSQVYKFIQKMPKGALLHGHDSTLVSNDYIYQLTYEDNLYACTVDDRLKLKFSDKPPGDNSCEWNLIRELRKNSTYDDWLRSQLILNVKDPSRAYPDVNAVWEAMMNIFKTIEPMIAYKPTFQKAFYQALKELHEDNVMYLEFRSILPLLHDLNGTYYDFEETVQVFQDTIRLFTKDYPDFLGARMIYSPRRKTDDTITVDGYVNVLQSLKIKFPTLLAGFDLIGQEDLGRPLRDFVKQLQKLKKRTNFYFHAAETNWYGTSSDFNLVDSVLLGTKRIGHGFGLTKHPSVMKIVKERNIGIEVSPISNQVLKLVEDMRNHPAAVLIAEGFPVVITNDNPTCWGAKGLSYDFYMAFMGIASRNSDLRLLKQFAINSLKQSSLSESEKDSAFKLWERKWNEFLELILKENDT